MAASALAIAGSSATPPSVSYSSIWGGSAFDSLTGVAAGRDGSVYVCGWTESADVPVVAPFQSRVRGSTDAFVMKISSNNTVVYATYLGGSGQDQATSIAVDAAGNAYVAGWTRSWDFPLLNAYQKQLRGSRNAFVAKFNPSGSLLFSTYLGGSATDWANAVQVDASGVFVTGATTSRNFPAVNAPQPALRGNQDAFVTKLDGSEGRLLYSTYLGGSGSEQALGIAVLNGEAYITGSTDSLDFPVASPFQGANQGGQDAFVTKLSSTGTDFIYSTYVGGNAGSPGAPETGNAIAVTPSGQAIVVGTTPSRNFPLLNPLRSTITGSSNDVFIFQLTSSGTRLIFSTYLGGSAYDAATGVATDSAGNIFVVGESTSQDFPLSHALQSHNLGLYNAFVTELSPAGGALTFSSYWGGGGSDAASGLAIDANGRVSVTGSSTSWNFPRINSSIDNIGNFGGFILRIAAGAAAALRDFNGDGSNDLVWQNSGGETYVSYMDGVTVLAQSQLGGPTIWTIAGIADLNNDGVPDIVWRYPPTGEYWAWYMSRSGAATAVLQWTGTTAWTIDSLGDLDGDGNVDVLWTDPNNGSLWIWFMKSGTVLKCIQLSGPTAYRAIGIGDFDGDGHPDLILQNWITGELSAWIMNGEQTIRQVPLGGATPWQAVVVGDFNGDGYPDIVWRFPATGEVWLWGMKGLQCIQAVQIAPAGARVPH